MARFEEQRERTTSIPRRASPTHSGVTRVSPVLRVTRARRLLGLASTVVLWGGLGCGGSDGIDDEDVPTITVLVDGDERALGPSADDNQKFLVFLAMVRGYRSPTNRLASRIEYSEDLREWTYRLRQGVRWHDGVPVTAHDVAFSLDLYRHPDVLYAISQGVGNIETIHVQDDSTLTISWSRPEQGGLDGWTQFFPKHLLEDLDPADFYRWEFWKQPVGNGPYRYVRHVPRTLIELEANPDFYAGAPRIERVFLRLGTSNKLTELISGNVDLATYLEHSEVRALLADGRFRIYHSWAFTEPWVIHWNHRHRFLGSTAVRQALTRAIDKVGIRRALDFPDELPVVGGLSPWDRAPRLYANGDLDGGPPHDPDEARRLLEEAGWIDGDGDGVRERDGVSAEFALLAHDSGVMSTLETAVLIQDQLREVGVRMEIQVVERSVARAAYRAGEFDAEMNSFQNVPSQLLRRDFFGPGSPIGYRNVEVVALLEALVDELDPAIQDTLYAQINEILERDKPLTFLFPFAARYAASRRVRGLEDGMHPLEYMEELWIEEGR